MKSIFGIMLALCIVVAILVVGNPDSKDEPRTLLSTGNVSVGAYPSQAEKESCPKIMMATVYTVPLGETDNRRQRVVPCLMVYDKYGTAVVEAQYASPESTYSYKLDEEGNFKEVAWHYPEQGPDSECAKTIVEYAPETHAVEIRRWLGPAIGPPNSTNLWTYEKDDNGLVTKRTEAVPNGSDNGGIAHVYQRDTHGNVTHELDYVGGRLMWDKWHTYDPLGNEIMAGLTDMFGMGTAPAGCLIGLEVYENSAFDECGNWTCRTMDGTAFGSSGETLYDKSYTEYRSLLYYPD